MCNKVASPSGSHEGQYSDLTIAAKQEEMAEDEGRLQRSPGKGVDVALYLYLNPAGWGRGGSTHNLPFKFSLHLCGCVCVCVCVNLPSMTSILHINKTPQPKDIAPLPGEGDVAASCEISLLRYRELCSVSSEKP